MLGQLIVDSLIRPREAARVVLAHVPPFALLLQVGVAVTCIGMVLGYIAMAISGGAIDPISAALVRDPLIGAAIQFAMMLVLAALAWRIGGLFGGGGSFEGALAVIVWLNTVMLAIQLAQITAILVLPPAAALLSLMAVVWVLWAFSNFMLELHGFQSPFVVLGVSILTVIVLVFSVSMIAAILGIAPQGIK